MSHASENIVNFVFVALQAAEAIVLLSALSVLSYMDFSYNICDILIFLNKIHLPRCTLCLLILFPTYT